MNAAAVLQDGVPSLPVEGPGETLEGAGQAYAN